MAGNKEAAANQSLNVVCLKWGSLYSAKDVNILYRMVSRNLALPFRFICFTEDASELLSEIDAQPLPNFPEPDWKFARYCSAWRKLALFDSQLVHMRGKVLFLDLDVVIMGDLAPAFFHSPKFCMIRNWYQTKGHRGQASMMCFEVGQHESLLRRYLENPLKILNQYRTEQDYISGELGSEYCEFFPESWCKSYKKHVMPKGWRVFFRQHYPEPTDTKVLVFHGRPKPEDAILGQWGKRFAWYKRWYKRLKPSPWIANYWRL